MTEKRSADWQSGYDLGRAGKPYLRAEGDVSDDFANGYVHGRSEHECALARIKIERNSAVDIRRMLQRLGWRR